MERLLSNFVFATYRRIFKLLTAKERTQAIWLTVLTIIGAVADVIGLAALVPVMMAATDPLFIDNTPIMRSIYEAGGFETKGTFMVFLAIALLVIFLIKNAIAMYLYDTQSKYAFRVGTDLARRQFIKFYNRGYTYFQNTNSAEVVNQVMNVPTFFTSAILVSAINLFCEVLVIALIVVGIAVSDISLFLMLVAILLPSGYFIYNGTKNKLYQMGLEQAELYNQTYAKLQQSIFGYTDVRINNKEEVFLDSFIKYQDALNKNYQARYVLGLIPTRSLEVIAILGITITFIYTYLFAQSPEQLYGFIAVFAAAAFRILPSMNRLLVALMGIRSHYYTLDYLEDGGLPQKLDNLKGKPLPFNREIDFKNLSFTFEGADRLAVKNLNFTVKKGERIGIVGTSGSGKTTLMNLLLRFLVEQEGGIYVDGHKLDPMDRGSWRALLGYVKQDVYLMDATMKENVAFGETLDEIDDARVWDALRQASLEEFVKGLPQQLMTNVGELGSKVSGGQKQRIGIARALYSRAEVLVFDEATSALDTDTEHSITESIEKLKGQTIFAIAHRISTLEYCDRIIEMKNGEIVGIWSYAELATRH